MNLPSRIKKLAEGQGISITKLEKILNLSNGTIAKWDKSSPKIDNLRKVANYFNISLDYLADNRTPNPEAIKILANRFGVTTDYLLGNDDRSIAPNVSCLFEKPEITFDGETYQLNEDDRKKIRAALQLALYDAKKRKEHKKITDNQ